MADNDQEPLGETQFQEYMDPLDQTTFQSNLLQGQASEKFLSTNDLQDYRLYKSIRRKKIALWGTLSVVVLLLVISVIVYFTHIHPKLYMDHEPACSGNTFKKFEGQCFLYQIEKAESEFTDSVHACQQKCLEYHNICRSVDFVTTNGECTLFSVTTIDRPGYLEYGKLGPPTNTLEPGRRTFNSCEHYDRNC